MSDHRHVVDQSSEGAYEVNTFDRAASEAERPLTELPQVLHYRKGRPESAIATRKEIDITGRVLVRVMQPSTPLPGHEPFIQTYTVPADKVCPHPDPMPEANAFLKALAMYRYNPNDYYWDKANEALAAWHEASAKSTPRRLVGALARLEPEPEEYRNAS